MVTLTQINTTNNLQMSNIGETDMTNTQNSNVEVIKHILKGMV